MRARSAYLMTSWWVVGIWIGLTLLTGIVSVISVTQPTWYVRYTLVHAQALQEVSFQVVVSSVGPLGFCRLVSVESRPVIDYTSITSTLDEDELSTVKHNPLTPVITTTTSDDSLKLEDLIGTTYSSTSPLQTTNNQETDETAKSTTVSGSLEAFTTKGGREDGDLFLEWPPTSHTTLGFQDEQTTLEAHFIPTPFPDFELPEFSGKDAADVRLDNTASEASLPPLEMSTIGYDYTMTAEGDAESDVLFRVTEGYTNVINEVQERKVEEAGKGDENNTDFQQERKSTEISSTETSITIERSMTPIGLDAVENVRNKGVYLTENVTDMEEVVFKKHVGLYDNQASYKRRKKKKKKRKNKKKQKKKPRNQARNEYKNREGEIGEKIKINIPTSPITFLTDETFINDSLLIRKERNIIQEGIKAEFLVHHQPPIPFERNTPGINYKPRRPILACSGVVIGVRSGSSAVWVLVGVVYGVAGIVQVMVGFFSILSQALKSPSGRYAHAIWMGNVQVAVVMSQGVTLVLYPLGLGSPLARVECGGSSSVYWSGDCSFGWGYMLAIVSTTLAAYCPCLARLTVYKKYAIREWESLNFF